MYMYNTKCSSVYNNSSIIQCSSVSTYDNEDVEQISVDAEDHFCPEWPHDGHKALEAH